MHYRDDNWASPFLDKAYTPAFIFIVAMMLICIDFYETFWYILPPSIQTVLLKFDNSLWKLISTDTQITLACSNGDKFHHL